VKETTGKNLFVIVPQHVPSGPVKGALAICNYLCDYMPVTFVAVKTPVQQDGTLRPEVRTLSLAEGKGIFQKARMFRTALAAAGGRKQNVSLSMCFAADLVNLFAAGLATRITSVRGNLLRNYAGDYGPAGIPFAIVHLLMLHGMDLVLSMSDAMTRQLRLFGHFGTRLIRNFIDEDAAARDAESNADMRAPTPTKEADGEITFAFLGSLTRRKRPELVIDTVAKLQGARIPSRAVMVGSGPLAAQLAKYAEYRGVSDRIRFAGQVRNPLPELKHCDYLLLPSSSEGVPRAALESLFVGVPCILRDVDANRELIREGRTGLLFKDDEELSHVVMQAATAHQRSAQVHKDILLPAEYRQANNCKQLLEILLNGK
jgi:glycosyltransferase involved in cell wall biosynthesis